MEKYLFYLCIVNQSEWRKQLLDSAQSTRAKHLSLKSKEKMEGAGDAKHNSKTHKTYFFDAREKMIIVASNWIQLPN